MLLDLLLVGCNLPLSPTPDDPHDEFVLYDADLLTNYRGSDGRYYICDNYTTQLSYAFSYRGDLISWTSYVKGELSDRVRGYATFTLRSPNVRYDRSAKRVEVTYDIYPYTAPLSVEEPLESVTPQSIVVVPTPVIVGYSKLHLQINGVDDSYVGESEFIPIIDPC